MWNELSLKQKVEEVFAGVAFVAFIALLCFMPDFTQL